MGGWDEWRCAFELSFVRLMAIEGTRNGGSEWKVRVGSGHGGSRGLSEEDRNS